MRHSRNINLVAAMALAMTMGIKPTPDPEAKGETDTDAETAEKKVAPELTHAEKAWQIGFDERHSGKPYQNNYSTNVESEAYIAGRLAGHQRLKRSD